MSAKFITKGSGFGNGLDLGGMDLGGPAYDDFRGKFDDKAEKVTVAALPINEEFDATQLNIYNSIRNGWQSAFYAGTYGSMGIQLQKMDKNNFTHPDRLEETVQLAFRLRHPNVITIIAFVEWDSSPCIITTRMSGLPLADHLFKYKQKQLGPMAPSVIGNWAVQLATALRFLERHNVQPLLNSSNVKVNPGAELPNLQVTDVGAILYVDLASTITTQDSRLLWYAPEMLRLSPFGSQTESWSFGVVLWEMLTLALPYRESSEPFVKEKVIRDIGYHSRILPLPEGLPTPLKTTLQSCFQQLPEARPTVQALVLLFKSHATDDFACYKDSFFGEEYTPIKSNEKKASLIDTIFKKGLRGQGTKPAYVIFNNVNQDPKGTEQTDQQSGE